MWLKVEPSGASRVTLTWGNSDGPYLPSYAVGLATLTNVSGKIRTNLEKIAILGSTGDPKDRQKLLAQLARDGAELRFLLFDCPQEKLKMGPLKSWIAGEIAGGDTALTITAD